MDFFQSVKTTDPAGAWDEAEPYTQEARALHPIRTLFVQGGVEVIFRRMDTPTLIVAGDNAEAVRSVKTRYPGDTLVIEQEGVTIQIGNRRMTCHGSISQGLATGAGGIAIGGGLGHGKVVVAIGLPECPAVRIQGSGEVTLLDLRQPALALDIEGSGDITAVGLVHQLTARVTGSGDVDARGLSAEHADLTVAGSGDIEAWVRAAVRARVQGSGDIVVHGNPPRRDHRVAGSGDIRFREEA
ncbi:hypothetical protein BUE93_20230 [Chromobacterium amazonense]|uniref:Putative auto-transporter adhesin head GIN domain-containing protein n=1 Tax=Chromobacterium amazonense TaxID=1382803 RepID=A0A2S9WZ89_9NEIS|nr:DUF2807 domain-containing protein [Chromobacterium amazonense]PRP68779.1 hypothetical protein BUE93_20230 [Chromobacterium amazonense]